MSEDQIQQFLFLLFIAGVLMLAVGLGMYYQRMLRKAYFDVAAELRLSYDYVSYGLPRRLPLVYQLRRGKNRYASNVFKGRYKGFPVYVFNYHYATGDKRNKVHHYSSIAMLRHDLEMPELHAYPPDIYEKVGHMAGIDNIEVQTGDDAFSKAFTVLASDADFAKAFCTPGVMAYLMRHPDMSVEVGPGWMATCIQQRLVPAELKRRMDQMLKLLRVVPSHQSRQIPSSIGNINTPVPSSVDSAITPD
jgi:hypothetical protein